MLIFQVYVDDIIFGSTNENIRKKYFDFIHNEFEMSMMRKINIFFGLQIKQQTDEIFTSQEKYIKDLLKKFK